MPVLNAPKPLQAFKYALPDACNLHMCVNAVLLFVSADCDGRHGVFVLMKNGTGMIMGSFGWLRLYVVGFKTWVVKTRIAPGYHLCLGSHSIFPNITYSHSKSKCAARSHFGLRLTSPQHVSTPATKNIHRCEKRWQPYLYICLRLD